MLGLFFILKGRPVPAHGRAGKLTVTLGMLHLATTSIAALLYGFNVITQNILPHLIIGGLTGMYVYWLVLRIGLDRGGRA